MPPRTRQTAAAKKAADKAAAEAATEATTDETPDEQAPDATVEAQHEAALQDEVDRLTAELAARDDKPKDVIQAILAVMRDVTHVGKEGTNEHQGFNFRGIDGTVNALGPAMRRHGLVVLPRVVRNERQAIATSNNRSMTSVVVEVEYRFFGPGGVDDTISVTTPGESFDSGDKATAKAMSVAFRTALLQAFALPTQEPDPDADSYERLQLPKAEDIVAEVQRATQDAQSHGAPVSQAIAAVGDHHTRQILEQVTITVKGGQKVSGAVYIGGMVDYWIAQENRAAQQRADEERAAKERADQQDGADTDSADSAPDAERPSAPEAEQPSAPSAEQSAPVESTRERAAAEQTERDVASSSAPKNDYVAQLVNEISGHAAVLGVDPREYVQPLVALRPNAQKVADLPPGVIRQWVVDARPRVAEALRANGRATAAHALETGPGEPIRDWNALIASDAQRAEAHV